MKIVIICSPSCCSKPEWLSFYNGKQKSVTAVCPQNESHWGLKQYRHTETFQNVSLCCSEESKSHTFGMTKWVNSFSFLGEKFLHESQHTLPTWQAN